MNTKQRNLLQKVYLQANLLKFVLVVLPHDKSINQTALRQIIRTLCVQIIQW